MIRTQVYLTEEQSQDIKLRALREKKPIPEVTRELLEAGRQASTSRQGETTGESLLRLGRIGGKGPADLSERIDDYLYEQDK